MSIAETYDVVAAETIDTIAVVAVVDSDSKWTQAAQQQSPGSAAKAATTLLRFACFVVRCGK